VDVAHDLAGGNLEGLGGVHRDDVVEGKRDHQRVLRRGRLRSHSAKGRRQQGERGGSEPAAADREQGSLHRGLPFDWVAAKASREPRRRGTIIAEKKPGARPGLSCASRRRIYAALASFAGLAFFAALPSFAGFAALPSFAALPDLAGLVASASSVASGRSTSSTSAIGALSPWRKPNFRIRR